MKCVVVGTYDIMALDRLSHTDLDILQLTRVVIEVSTLTEGTPLENVRLTSNISEIKMEENLPLLRRNSVGKDVGF